MFTYIVGKLVAAIFNRSNSHFFSRREGARLQLNEPDRQKIEEQPRAVPGKSKRREASRLRKNSRAYRQG